MLANRAPVKPTIGECEVCNEPVPGTEVWLISGNIWACAQHKAENDALVSHEKVSHSQQVDAQVVIKTDLMLAETVPAVELRAAIQADETIPESEKEYAFAKAGMERYLQFKAAVFEERTAINERLEELKKTEKQMWRWQVDTQSAVGKLREDLRAQFKELDINYKPAPIPKKVKTVKPVATPKKTFNKKEVFAAAEKYGVPANGVQMIVTSRNLSPEDAAKYLADIMKKKN